MFFKGCMAKYVTEEKDIFKYKKIETIGFNMKFIF